MKSKKSARRTLLFALITVCLLSVMPAHAAQNQVQVGTVSFHLTGQANSMNGTATSLGSAALDLVGGVLADGQGGLVMANVTGNLQIGSVNYSIHAGNGTSNRLGEFAFFGQSNPGELILHGTVQHNTTVTTEAPPSRLSSIAYLALSGSLTLSLSTNMSLVDSQSSPNSTSTVENSMTTEVGVNSTQFQSSSSSILNFTFQSDMSTENVTQIASNTTIVSQTVTYALPGQSNTTIVPTRLGNQTVTVYISTSVADSTITQTTTTTIANTTVTQFSQVTVSDTTVIVTNSTTSSP